MLASQRMPSRRVMQAMQPVLFWSCSIPVKQMAGPCHRVMGIQARPGTGSPFPGPDSIGLASCCDLRASPSKLHSGSCRLMCTHHSLSDAGETFVYPCIGLAETDPSKRQTITATADRPELHLHAQSTDFSIQTPGPETCRHSGDTWKISWPT